MIKKTIGQVIYQLRNQPLLSAITILGTALAIALIMVILIVYQAKTADYAPEVNRSRSLYVKWERTVYDKKEPNSAGHSRPSLWMAKEVFYPLKTPEAVCVTYEAGEVLVSTPGADEEVNTPLLLTDADFWKIYQFHYLSGKPFTQADFQSGIKKAVIAESVARRLYGDVDAAIGKPVLINFTDYTVCGVVENVNRFCEFAWSEVYAPYSSNAIANKVEAGETQGNHVVTILAHSSDDFEKIRNEVARGVAD
jgi:putative ABC transport system permease protein